MITISSIYTTNGMIPKLEFQGRHSGQIYSSAYQSPQRLGKIYQTTHVDSVSNHTKTSEDDKPSLSPLKQQNLEVAPYTPPPEGRHEERYF